MGTGLTPNLAQAGEPTEPILWRMEHGLARKLTPQAVVVGANNLVAVERHLVPVMDPRKDLADADGVIRADPSGFGGLRLNDAGREALVAALAATMKGQP